MPFRIGRVFHLTLIKVGGTIIQPYRAALTQLDLGLLNSRPRARQLRLIT